MGRQTESFSTIGPAPRTEALSKVSIDCSRCGASVISMITKKCRRRRSRPGVSISYIKAGKALAIRVELVIVEFDELLWKED